MCAFARIKSDSLLGYRFLIDYRSPVLVADFIGKTLPELPFVCANDLPWLGVGVTSYTDPPEQPKLVGRIVARTLAQRFHPQDIAILSCRGLE